MSSDEVKELKARRHERDIDAVIRSASIGYRRCSENHEKAEDQCSIRGWPLCGL